MASSNSIPPCGHADCPFVTHDSRCHIHSEQWLTCVAMAAATNPEAALAFISSCTYFHQMLHEEIGALKPTISLSFVYPILHRLSVRGRESLRLLHSRHRNQEATMLLGVYEGWYNRSYEVGISLLNITASENHAQSVYNGNIMYRLVHRPGAWENMNNEGTKPVRDMRSFIPGGGGGNAYMLPVFRYNLMCMIRGLYDCVNPPSWWHLRQCNTNDFGHQTWADIPHISAHIHCIECILDRECAFLRDWLYKADSSSNWKLQSPQYD